MTTSTPAAASCRSGWRWRRTSARAWCGACRSAKISRFPSANSSSSSCTASRSRAPMPRIPFQKRYALTVGNSLRRTLLSIVPGAAVSWVKIDGVRSAFTRIPAVTESTVDVLLNLKKLSVQVPSQEPRVVRLEVTGPKTVKGEDVPETDVEIMNPEVMLFTVESGARVNMELGIGVGRGYEAADHKREAPAGALVVDAAFSPITRVAYNVE